MNPPTNITNHIGKQFGRLTVVSYAGPHQSPDRIRHKWHCVCDCGNETDVLIDNLTRGHSRSCGCLKRDVSRQLLTTHGMTGTPEHNTWTSLKTRCLNKNGTDYSDYGGRGITVCARWLDSFENFYEDMGARPSPNHSIERIDNDGPYSPENCIWATSDIQANNKRLTIRLTLDGETHTIKQWAKILDIKPSTIRARLSKDWPIHEVLSPTKPPGKLRIIEFQGERHHLSEWARILGISRNVLNARINIRGWSVKKAFTTPVQR